LLSENQEKYSIIDNKQIRQLQMQKYKRKLLCLLKNKEMKNKERGES
jgi:hypothetical protein